jgi:hypothetical protein
MKTYSVQVFKVLKKGKSTLDVEARTPQEAISRAKKSVENKNLKLTDSDCEYLYLPYPGEGRGPIKEIFDIMKGEIEDE